MLSPRKITNQPELVALPERVCDRLKYGEFDTPVPHLDDRLILRIDAE
jgi:hypothetical protein